MAHSKSKHLSREGRAILRDVLMREWDPIGVKGISGAEDEYDFYVGKLYALLIEDRASCDRLYGYLLDAAINHMGLSAHPLLIERSRRAAETLIKLRSQLEIH